MYEDRDREIYVERVREEREREVAMKKNVNDVNCTQTSKNILRTIRYLITVEQ